jgi:hypothetical protein
VADLITILDIEARRGQALTPVESARVVALIADASALARFEAGQDFSLAVDDVAVLRRQGDKLLLPQWPVTGVKQVEVIGIPPVPNLVLPAAGAWAFDGIDAVLLYLQLGWIINLPADWVENPNGTGSYRVTYSHGWAPVPADIVAVVCNMVMRTLTSPSMAEGLTGENIGQYGYQMSQQAGAMGSGVRVTAADRAVLRNPKYRRTMATKETPI